MAVRPEMEASILLIFQVFIILCSISLVDQCGISTHITIAHQALQYFDDRRGNTSYRDLVLTHQDAFIAGNPYPDAMYSDLCFNGKFHQVSEDTHWSPFLNATVNYIRKNYPKPWSKETEKLVVFMLGFVSHQVADITWHSLGIDQGFLQTMGKVNFFGSFPAAHSIGDPGGDMIATFEGDTQKISSAVENWYVPSEDLAKIYNEYYGKNEISAEQILKCTKIMYLGWIGEKIGGAKLFKKYAKTSPYLMEELHNYFQGGISDMAAWTGLIWHDAITMLEHGTNICNIPRNPLFIQCNKSKGLYSRKTSALKNPGKVFLSHSLEELSLNDIVTHPTKQGAYLHPTKQLYNKILSRRQAARRSQRFESIEDEPQGFFQYFTDIPYANLGWSLAQGNFSGLTRALVISAPNYGLPGKSQHGRVFVVNANDGALPQENLKLDDQADNILDGNDSNGRFGTSLAVLDFNHDGVDDLAVSASSTGADSLQYKGTVYIYHGIPGKGLESEPSIKIIGKDQYYNLGVTLKGADIDNDGHNDLIIGSPYANEGGPQRGSVGVFLSSIRRKAGMEYTIDDADIKLVGQQDFSWFGYSIEFVHSGERPLLFVGAPTFRICSVPDCKYSPKDIQSVGRVYVFDAKTNSTLTPIVTITGHETFMKFGTSLAFGRPRQDRSNGYIAVSAPTQNIQGKVSKLVSETFDQCGSVYVLSVSELASRKGDIALTSLHDVTLFEGDRAYARFGWKVGFADVNLDGLDDLIMSAPFRTSDITEELTGAEEGEVYAFYGGSDFPTGKATRGCTFDLTEPCPADKASDVFKSTEERSRLGASFINFSQSPLANNVVLAATRSSRHAFHSGQLLVYKYTPSVE